MPLKPVLAGSMVLPTWIRGFVLNSDEAEGDWTLLVEEAETDVREVVGESAVETEGTDLETIPPELIVLASPGDDPLLSPKSETPEGEVVPELKEGEGRTKFLPEGVAPTLDVKGTFSDTGIVLETFDT